MSDKWEMLRRVQDADVLIGEIIRMRGSEDRVPAMNFPTEVVRLAVEYRKKYPRLTPSVASEPAAKPTGAIDPQVAERLRVDMVCIDRALRDGSMTDVVSVRYNDLKALLATVAPQEEKAAPKRCPICDWPLVARIEDGGCVEGNCSYRPKEGTDEYHRIQARREQLQVDKPTPAQPQAEARARAKDAMRNGLAQWHRWHSGRLSPDEVSKALDEWLDNWIAAAQTGGAK